MKSKSFKKKSLSPLISTILLVVVAVILVTLLLTWGKETANTNLSRTDDITSYNILNDKRPFLSFVEAKNGMYVFDYFPPANKGDINFTISKYSLVGYNDFIPLEPEYTFSRTGRHFIPLGIINEDRFTISLLLSDGKYLNFENITNTNNSPSTSDCPEGYIPVPGNHLYGTVGNKGGFCVMKWEAKTDAPSETQTACRYNTNNYSQWRHLKTVTGHDCNVSKYNIVSTEANYPIAVITQLDAKAECIRMGGHLITNEEWMTLARNIEMVSSNWSSGVVGNGYLSRGNSSNILVNNSYVYDGSVVGLNENKRTFKLSNNNEIWDLAGNVWEWVDKTKSELYFDCDNFSNEFGYCEESDESEFFFENYSDLYNYVDFSKVYYKDLFLLNKDYNMDNSVGYYYDYFVLGNVWAFLRGGHWYNSAIAGLLALYLGNGTSDAGLDRGFRCVVVPK